VVCTGLKSGKIPSGPREKGNWTALTLGASQRDYTRAEGVKLRGGCTTKRGQPAVVKQVAIVLYAREQNALLAVALKGYYRGTEVRSIMYNGVKKKQEKRVRYYQRTLEVLVERIHRMGREYWQRRGRLEGHGRREKTVDPNRKLEWIYCLREPNWIGGKGSGTRGYDWKEELKDPEADKTLYRPFELRRNNSDTGEKRRILNKQVAGGE